jgi:hypothetical protein
MQLHRGGKHGVIAVPDDVRLMKVGSHVPAESTIWRRCRECSSAAKEKRTKILCSACKVPLCAVPCFSKFHGK